VKAVGGDIGRAATALAEFGAPTGRGAQSEYEISGGCFRLIDESYNANPASMAAALGVLSAVAKGRKIAVLGDMLELGAASGEMHRGLAAPIEAAAVDRVFCCGPDMRGLYETLPAVRRGTWAMDSAALKDDVLNALQPGDTVMVKGSLGSRMGLIIEALRQAGTSKTAAA
jgi:UDP-N-acetylmuramoyl-tripeptide--D-alanyl-D-alanine ligase